MSSRLKFHTLQDYLKMVLPTTIEFYEHAIHIGGPQKFFTVSPLSSHSLLAIFQNILELEQYTNRN
jgi:hypothetical protein